MQEARDTAKEHRENCPQYLVKVAKKGKEFN